MALLGLTACGYHGPPEPIEWHADNASVMVSLSTEQGRPSLTENTLNGRVLHRTPQNLLTVGQGKRGQEEMTLLSSYPLYMRFRNTGPQRCDMTFLTESPIEPHGYYRLEVAQKTLPAQQTLPPYAAVVPSSGGGVCYALLIHDKGNEQQTIPLKVSPSLDSQETARLTAEAQTLGGRLFLYLLDPDGSQRWIDPDAGHLMDTIFSRDPSVPIVAHQPLYVMFENRSRLHNCFIMRHTREPIEPGKRYHLVIEGRYVDPPPPGKEATWVEKHASTIEWTFTPLTKLLGGYKNLQCHMTLYQQDHDTKRSIEMMPTR